MSEDHGWAWWILWPAALTGLGAAALGLSVEQGVGVWLLLIALRIMVRHP